MSVELQTMTSSSTSTTPADTTAIVSGVDGCIPDPVGEGWEEMETIFDILVVVDEEIDFRSAHVTLFTLCTPGHVGPL